MLQDTTAQVSSREFCEFLKQHRFNRTPPDNYLQVQSDSKFALKYVILEDIKDNDGEKAPSNETPALAKNMNIDIQVVGTSK